MNLKKSLLSVIATAAIVSSMGVSLVGAAEGDSNQGSAGTYNTGSFNYSMWGSSYTFGTVGLDTSTADQALPTKVQQLDYRDYRTDHGGYTIQMTASDFVANDGTGHKFLNSHLKISHKSVWNGVEFSCLSASAVENPDNLFAKPQSLAPATAMPMTTAVNILKTDAGRGCGTWYQQVNLNLTVPQGTYTGGSNSAAPLKYVSTITVSTVAVPIVDPN